MGYSKRTPLFNGRGKHPSSGKGRYPDSKKIPHNLGSAETTQSLISLGKKNPASSVITNSQMQVGYVGIPHRTVSQYKLWKPVTSGHSRNS